MPEVRPPLLDYLSDTARRRSGPGGPSRETGHALNFLRRHAMNARPDVDDDEDDEVFDDEDFDGDSDVDEDEDDVDEEDGEEEETWQVFAS